MVADCRPENLVSGSGVNVLRATGLKHPEQFAGIKVVNGDRVEFAVSVPVKLSSVDPVGSVDRFGGARAHKKSGSIERGSAVVLESNRKVDLVIVLETGLLRQSVNFGDLESAWRAVRCRVAVPAVESVERAYPPSCQLFGF